MLAVAWLAGPKPFYFDSGGYWRLSVRFERAGVWSLLNFNDQVRGFLAPLFYGGLREVAGLFGDGDAPGSAVVKIFNAAVLAAIATVLLPRLAELTWARVRVGLLPRLALAAALLLFWRGYLNFPLTDLPALALGLVALLAAARAPRPIAMVVAGLAVGAAIDLRPAYVLLAAGVVLLAVLDTRQADRWRADAGRAALATTLVVLGMGVVLVPQTLITHRNFDVWSPIPSAAANLTSFQLSAGLKLQRYETYVGTEYGPQLNYYDPDTASLDPELGEFGTVAGYPEYAKLAVNHPLVIGGVAFGHLVNGLDQRYSTPYIEELDTGGQRPLRLAGFLVIFLGLLRLAWPGARRSLGPARWRYPTMLVAGTVLTTLPSAMESRFLFPLFAVLLLLAVTPGWPIREMVPSPSRGIRGFAGPATVLVALALFLAGVTSITSGATKNLSLVSVAAPSGSVTQP